MRNATANMAGPNASITSGGGGPTSRRSTRIVGTRDSCSSGGSANPASTATAVMKPMTERLEIRRGQIRIEQTRGSCAQPLLRKEAQRWNR